MDAVMELFTLSSALRASAARVSAGAAHAVASRAVAPASEAPGLNGALCHSRAVRLLGGYSV